MVVRAEAMASGSSEAMRCMLANLVLVALTAASFLWWASRAVVKPSTAACMLSDVGSMPEDSRCMAMWVMLGSASGSCRAGSKASAPAFVADDTSDGVDSGAWPLASAAWRLICRLEP